MVTDPELAQIIPRLAPAKRAEYLPLLQESMRRFGITTRLREAAFLAQLAHESGSFRYLEEIASGGAYEGRKDLGNTQPGDGRRYKGRGWIMITGRANYREYGRILGLKLEQNPQLASRPDVAAAIAGLYWSQHGLNEMADRRDFRGITKAINGGYTHLAERLQYYRCALAVLNNDGVPNPITVAVGDVELENNGTLQDGAAWIPVREAVEMAQGQILRAGNGVAQLARKGHQGEVELQILEGVGYAKAREVGEALGLLVQWSPADRTVTLDFPERVHTATAERR